MFRVVEEMKHVEVKVLQGNKWQVEGELILKEEKIYISKDEELRVEIIWLHYDVLATRYKEKWKTTK